MLLVGNLKFLEDRFTNWVRLGLILILVTCLLAASATSTNDLEEGDSRPDVLDNLRLRRQIRSWRQSLLDRDDIMRAIKRNSESEKELERAYGWMERYPKKADRGGWGGGYGK